MKRKFIVGLIIFGMVFSGISIDFESVKARNPYFVVRGTITKMVDYGGGSDLKITYLRVEEILYKNIDPWLDFGVGDEITFEYYHPYIDPHYPELHVGDRVELRCSGWDGWFLLVWSEGDYVKIIGGEKLQAKIWIDKGCGATYKDGERIVVHYKVNKSAYLVIYDYLTGGGVQTINIGYVSAGTHGFTATVAGPAGKETLKLVAKDSQGYSDEDTCSFYIEKKDPCEGVTCPNQCRGYDLWAYECEDGECVPDYIIEKNSKQCGYDPCRGVSCGTVCRGYDLWQQKCKDGRCVDDYIIERNSKQCGYDPCKGVTCSDKCIGYNLWAYKCEEGGCVPDYIIEKNSKQCGYDPCEHDSDNDGVPDCEDECEDTPPEYYVDEKGCKVCLNKKAVCALQAKGLIPVYGVIPSSKIVINDLCLLADAINSGEDAITIILLADTLCRDAIGFIVDALMTIGKFDIRLTVLYTAIKSARLIIDCGLDFADSYGADKSFYIGIHDGLSEKFAGENINAMNLYVGSPVELVIKDEKGNVLSKDNDMGIQEGFFFEHNHYKFAFIINPEGEYKVETIGTDEGTYDLKIKTITDGKITKSKEFDDVYTSQGKVDTYNVNIASSGKVDIGKSGKSSFRYLSVVVIILLISTIGFYVYRGKKGGGMAGPPIFGDRSRLAKKLDRRYETGKINKDEYFQKMKDLELSPENKILKKLEEKFARGEISKEEYLQKKRDLEA